MDAPPPLVSARARLRLAADLAMADQSVATEDQAGAMFRDLLESYGLSLNDKHTRDVIVAVADITSKAGIHRSAGVLGLLCLAAIRTEEQVGS